MTVVNSPPHVAGHAVVIHDDFYYTERRVNFGGSTSCLKRRDRAADSLLLFHELFAGCLDRDGETELGGVLNPCVSCEFERENPKLDIP